MVARAATSVRGVKTLGVPVRCAQPAESPEAHAELRGCRLGLRFVDGPANLPADEDQEDQADQHGNNLVGGHAGKRAQALSETLIGSDCPGVMPSPAAT